MIKPTRDQFDTYQALYDYFNKKLFKNELPPCMLNFSRNGKKNAGHFSPERWHSNKSKTHEININPYHLLTASDKEVCQTLVHEMCHLWQQEYGRPSRRGYHNKEWGTKMREVGLCPSNTGAKGGKQTGQQMSDYVIEDGNFEEAFDLMPKKLLLPFWSFEDTEEKKPKPKSKIKYTCPFCETKVWGKPGIKIVCFQCPEDRIASHPLLLMIEER